MKNVAPPVNLAPLKFSSLEPSLHLNDRGGFQEFEKKRFPNLKTNTSNRALTPVGTGVSEGEFAHSEVEKTINFQIQFARGTHTKSNTLSLQKMGRGGGVRPASTLTTPEWRSLLNGPFSLFFLLSPSFFLFLGAPSVTTRGPKASRVRPCSQHRIQDQSLPNVMF